MILAALIPLMQRVPPSYLRRGEIAGGDQLDRLLARVFPAQSVAPRIGAGSIPRVHLSIGYYITPEIVGGTGNIHLEPDCLPHLSSLELGPRGRTRGRSAGGGARSYWAYDKIRRHR